MFVVLAASLCGDQIAAVALLFRLVDERRPGIAVAILFGALVVPRAVFGPFAGVLVDRYDTRRVVTLMMVLQALVAVGIAYDEHAVVSIAGAYALGALATVVNAAVFALLPTMLGAERVTAANGYYELATSVSASIGPVLGGVLVAGLGGRVALLVDAASFAIVVPVLLASRIERVAPGSAPEPETRGIIGASRLGGRLLFADPVLRRTMMAVITGVLATSAIDVALVYFVAHHLHGGTVAYGVMLGLWGLGMLVGSMAAPALIQDDREQMWLFGGIAAIGLAIGVAGVLPNPVVLGVMFTIGGIANALFNIAGRTLVHHRIEPQFHGRVGAARLAVISVAVAAGFAIGGVFGPTRSRAVYIVAGALTVAATALSRARLDQAGGSGDGTSPIAPS